MMKKDPTLSLCMIVKNEEEFLAQCLDSVRSVVDEMIIVDTGSTDKTVQIAESYGAKVYHHPWNGSFSEARNVSLSKATGDWILQLDADEALEQEDVPVLKKVLRSDLYNAVFVALLNDTSDGWSKHYFQRLFRRGKAHYEGIVHNQLKFEGACLNSEIRVYHWGYNLSKEKMAAKYKRTEALLLKQLEEDRTDPFASHNYLRILRVQQRYEDAVLHGKRALEICKERMKPHHHQMIAYDTAFSQMLVGDFKGAEKLCREILQLYPQNLDLLFTMGMVQFSKKSYEEAVRRFKQFLDVLERVKKEPKNDQLIVDSFSFDHKAWYQLAKCYLEMQRCDPALEAIDRAISIKEDILKYTITRAVILVKSGETGKARACLLETERHGNPNPDFYVTWSAMAQKTTALGNQVEILERGLKRFPESDEIHNSLAYAIYSKDKSASTIHWQKSLILNPNHQGALLGLIRGYAEEKKSDKLNVMVHRLLEQTGSRQVLRNAGSYCLKAQYYEQAIELFSKYLTLDKSAAVLADIATCYAKLEQFDAALVGYKEAYKLDSKNPVLIKNIQILEKALK